LLEKENGILSEESLFSFGSANRGILLRPKNPPAGQKSIRLAKKGGGSPFPVAGFRLSRRAFPLPPRLFAEIKMGDREGFSRPFLASAPGFLPGQQGDRFKRPTKFEGDALNFIIAGYIAA
jgi:hypothetical protein